VDGDDLDAALILLIIVLALAAGLLLNRLQGANDELRLRAGEVENARRDAVKRSTSVVRGKVTEALAPFFPDFPYSPREVRFLGTPIDLIVFEGLDENEVERVVFVEVKSGRASLSRRERSVRECIERGDVAYELLRLPVMESAESGELDGLPRALSG
jgi:predicted Holliday junction resolvase-like endonuclease